MKFLVKPVVDVWYQGYSPEMDTAEAAKMFQTKYGYAPEHAVLQSSALLLGPIQVELKPNEAKLNERMNSNIYDRLTANGWTKVSDRNWHSYWHKKGWCCYVPQNIKYEVRFYRLKETK